MIVWSCTCGSGGLAVPQGIDSVDTVLKDAASRHLRQVGNEGHAISHGTLQGRIRLTRKPPLEWEKVTPDGQQIGSVHV